MAKKDRNSSSMKGLYGILLSEPCSALAVRCLKLVCALLRLCGWGMGAIWGQYDGRHCWGVEHLPSFLTETKGKVGPEYAFC